MTKKKNNRLKSSCKNEAAFLGRTLTLIVFSDATLFFEG
jgi:hypothetical protein